MKIKYEFVDGTKTEIEVKDEKCINIIIESRREEHAQDERERIHCYSLDALEYIGKQ